MSKILTPAEFEAAARAVIAAKQSSIDKLNASVADAERKVAEFAMNPSVESYEDAVRLETELSARKSLAKKITMAFSPDREYEKLLNVAAAKAVLSAYAETKQPVLQELRSQVSKLRTRAAKREEAGNSEHFDLTDQADDVACTLESYEGALRTFSEHLSRFPSTLDANINYISLRNRIDPIQA